MEVSPYGGFECGSGDGMGGYKNGQDGYDIDPFEIFEEIFTKEEQSAPARPTQERAAMSAPLGEEQFYEIEYDSGPFPGVGKFVLKSSRIQAPQMDEIRERFDRMRDIARETRSLYFNSSKFYDRRVQQENSRIFYKQGMFMEDFEDEYEKSVSYSAYYPGYQNMGYEQLRTYFTWRTKVRQGNIEGISLSYAFLYIYEVLNQIGVKNPEEGLDSLMVFWDAFRIYDRTIDKYLPGWLKDYHIYYGMEQSFREFVRQNNLQEYYPGLTESDDRFSLFCSISKYDIKKSVFYTDGNEELLRHCFAYTMQRLEQVFDEAGIRLEDFIFQPAKNLSEWIPFKGALFYPCLAQDDRKVVLSQKEIYVCSRDRWTFNTTLTTESGKKLVGYVMKQMEAVLRKAVKYKHKLSANSNMLSPAMGEELEQAGICLEKIVTQAALEYYRESNKTIVSVNPDSLDRIRREALVTQEKLIVPEQENIRPGMPVFTDESVGTVEEKECDSIKSVLSADKVNTEKEDRTEERKAFIGGDSVKSGKDVSIGEIPYGEILKDEISGQEMPDGESQTEEISCEKIPHGENPGREMFSGELFAGELSGERTSAERFYEGMEMVPGGRASGGNAPESGSGIMGENASPWNLFGNMLSATEFEAVAFILYRQTGEMPFSGRDDNPGFNLDNSKSSDSAQPGFADSQTVKQDLFLRWESIKQFADAHNIMPEVLADGINEKAMDQIGDSLFDDEFMIYEDYIEQTKEMVEEIWQRRYLQE